MGVIPAIAPHGTPWQALLPAPAVENPVTPDDLFSSAPPRTPPEAAKPGLTSISPAGPLVTGTHPAAQDPAPAPSTTPGSARNAPTGPESVATPVAVPAPSERAIAATPAAVPQAPPTSARPRSAPQAPAGANPCATMTDFRRPYCDQVLHDLTHR